MFLASLAISLVCSCSTVVAGSISGASVCALRVTRRISSAFGPDPSTAETLDSEETLVKDRFRFYNLLWELLRTQ